MAADLSSINVLQSQNFSDLVVDFTVSSSLLNRFLSDIILFVLFQHFNKMNEFDQTLQLILIIC